MTTLLGQRELKTRFGTFIEQMFENDVIVLTKGEISGQEAVLCRIHSSCLSGHAFASVECECLAEMEYSQRKIEETGQGIIIWLEQEGRGNGHLAVMQSTELKKRGMSQTEAYKSLGYPVDARSFEPAAEVLRELGAKSIRLLSASAKKAEELGRLGVVVSRLEDPNK